MSCGGHTLGGRGGREGARAVHGVSSLGWHWGEGGEWGWEFPAGGAVPRVVTAAVVQVSRSQHATPTQSPLLPLPSPLIQGGGAAGARRGRHRTGKGARVQGRSSSLEGGRHR